MPNSVNKPSYISIIAQRHPNVWVHSTGLGETYEELQITENSPEPLPTKEVLDAELKEEVLIQMWELIKVERDRRIAGGVKVMHNDIEYWFHSDNTSRIQQLALVILGASLPQSIMWKTMGGHFVELTQPLVQAVFSASVQSDMAVFRVAEQHKAAMIASAEPEHYNYLTGWPAIYGGSQLTA